MDRWKGRVALVTGASVGIGAAIVRTLVSHGMRVAGCARNVGKIQALAKELSDQPGSLLAIQCDLTKEDDILAMFAEIKKQYGGVDVCINNAGLGYKEQGTMLSGETDKWREMLEVNVLAVAICTRESYQSMKARDVDDGHIIHLNSIAGHAVIDKPMYSATKFAIRALTEGTRNELRQAKSHIRITSISPGLVETEFAYRATLDQDYARHLYGDHQTLESADIADIVTFVLGAPPHVQVHDIIVRPTEQIV